MDQQNLTIINKITETDSLIVNRIYNKKNNNRYLLKTIKDEHPSQSSLDIVESEYRILLQLKDQAGILYPHELISIGHNKAIILDDFPGITLKQYLQKYRDNLADILTIFINIFGIIDIIHRKNIIHKNLHPKIILIDPETLTTKIVDFSNCAEVQKESRHLINPYTNRAILPYISPEQTGRINRSTDFRSDYYSLGAILYIAATGCLPFHYSDELELVHAHIARTPDPPCLLNKAVPECLSKVIMKLLSKNAEDRYQSNTGIVHDLILCQKIINKKARDNNFVTGKHDISEFLHIPEKVYGRADQIKQLLHEFEQASAGNLRLVFVSGKAGIGKSYLINEIHKPIVQKNGYFISGKCNYLKQMIPYSSIIESFSDFIKQILTGSEREITQWKENIINTFGNNAGILTNIIPQLELLIGPQKKVEEFNQLETQNRFNLVIQSFIKLIATADHPLVFFLDDIQWIDQASIKLLDTLLSNTGLKYFLLIGAYRENEVHSRHRLNTLFNTLNVNKLNYMTIRLTPLNKDDINSFLQDTLSLRPAKTGKLATLMKEKTSGVPLFVKEFLVSLANKQLISFHKGWSFNIKDIQNARITDNMANLLLNKTKDLQQEQVEILQQAAIIGITFDIETLVAISNRNKMDIQEILKQTINEGIIIKSGTTFRFSHDKLYESVYNTIDEQTRTTLHKKIGDYLQDKKSDRTTRSVNKEFIFEIVYHLNNAMKLITSENDIINLTTLNLQAGQQAKSSTAYDSALEYFTTAVNLLPAPKWSRYYTLSLELYSAIGEILYITNNKDHAEKYFNEVLDYAYNSLDKVRVFEVRIDYYTIQQHLEKALQVGIEGLRMLNCRMPRKTNKLSILLDLLKLKFKLSKQTFMGILDSEELTDSYTIAAANLLMACTVPSYMRFPLYLVIIILKLMSITIKHGNSIYSSYAFIGYSLLLSTGLKDIQNGNRYGKLALQLSEKYNSKSIQCKVVFIYGNMINHWTHHLREDIPYLLHAYELARETGDMLWGAYAINYYAFHIFFTGNPLDKVIGTYNEYYESMKNTKHQNIIQAYEYWYQLVHNLRGDTTNKWKISGTFFNEDKQYPVWRKNNNLNSIGFFILGKMMVYYLYEDYKKAIEVSQNGKKYFDSIGGTHFIPESYFFASLVRLARFRHVSGAVQRQYSRTVKKYQKKLQYWAHHAPMNYKHKYLIIKAMLGQYRMDFEQCIRIFNEAIKSAQNNDFLFDEAIANEQAMIYCINRDMNVQASHYAREAHYLYMRWGALLKADEFEKKYSHILNITEKPGQQGLLSINNKSQIIDLTSVIKASQVISGEIIFDTLLEKLINIIIENSGAQRCIIILNEQNDFYVAAVGTVNKRIQVLPFVLLEDYKDVPHSIINYTRRTHESVTSDDEQFENLFINDKYLQKKPVLSLITVPLLKLNELIGIIYLENSISKSVFTRERVEIIQLLARQSTISLENSLLYEKSTQAEQEIQKQYEEIQSQYEEMEAINDELEKTYLEIKKVNEDLAIFKEFAEASSNGLWMTHLDGKLLYLNNALCSMTKYNDKAELLTKNIETMIPLQEIDIYKNDIVPALMHNHYWIGEFPLLSSSGENISSLQNMFIIKDSMNEPLYIASVVTDISKRKEMEQELLTSKEKYRNLVETMKEGLGIFNDDGMFLYANNSLSAMLGYPVEKLIGKTAQDFLDPENYDKFKNKVISDTSSYNQNIEIKWSKKGPGSVYTIVSPQTITDANGERAGVFGVITDISDKKHLEDQLIQAQKMEAIGNLAGGIAHDFNNILTAITGYGDLLKESLDPSGKEYKYNTEILKAAHKSSALTNQLLAFSRQQILQKKATNLNSIVIEMKKLVERLIGENIKLVTDLQVDIAPVYIDPSQIEQTILNIAVNARDAMPDGGQLTIKTGNIRISSKKFNNAENMKTGFFIYLSISDTGTGIDKNTVQNIFDPFFTTKEIGKGTGLGLAVVYGIIKQHDGWIDVKTDINKGTTFTIYLPKSDIEKSPVAANNSKNTLEKLQGSGETILVIEDQEDITNFVMTALSQNGYNVVSAGNAKSARSLFKKHRDSIALIFSDVVLPDGNGVNLVEELQQENPGINVILTSGYSDNKSRWNTITDKGYTFLQKPYNLLSLLDFVKKKIDKKK